jgi:hypothetical protein
MAVRTKESPAPHGSGSSVPPQEGLWGHMTAQGEKAGVLRLIRGSPQETVSFPYDTLSRWHWCPGAPETLQIAASTETLIILGRKLDLLVDALDQGRLMVIREMRQTMDAGESVPFIQSIEIKAKQSSGN